MPQTRWHAILLLPQQECGGFALPPTTGGALHVLSGCQNNVISGMITERHNIACRLIMKAIGKGALAGF